MKRQLIFALLVAGAVSCKKEPHDCPEPTPEPTPSTPSTAPFTMLKPGNYWVYEQVKVDPNGTETLMQLDSMYVSGDTIVNGKTYANFHGGVFWSGLMRDSSGFLVNEYGSILFTNAVVGTPVRYESLGSSLGYVEFKTLTPRPSITVPAGTFANTYDWQNTYFVEPPFQSPRHMHHYYAENIGRVKFQFFYLSSPSVIEMRLLRYHVQ
jgi:hypothetical protein